MLNRTLQLCPGQAREGQPVSGQSWCLRLLNTRSLGASSASRRMQKHARRRDTLARPKCYLTIVKLRFCGFDFWPAVLVASITSV